MWELSVYFDLFLVAFGAATLLPHSWAMAAASIAPFQVLAGQALGLLVLLWASAALHLIRSLGWCGFPCSKGYLLNQTMASFRDYQQS